MNVATGEDDFAKLSVGDDWIPKYDHGLFKKAVNINYSAQRADYAVATPDENK